MPGVILESEPVASPNCAWPRKTASPEGISSHRGMYWWCLGNSGSRSHCCVSQTNMSIAGLNQLGSSRLEAVRSMIPFWGFSAPVRREPHLTQKPRRFLHELDSDLGQPDQERGPAS